MRILFWILSLSSVTGLWFAADIHEWLSQSFEFYRLAEPGPLQVTLGIIAGIFATKAADSSSELKSLLQVSEIRSLLDQADSARKSREEEEARLRKLANLVEHEAQQQYARDMLVRHRDQLVEHWHQVLVLQSMLAEPEPDILDPKVQKQIRNFIVKTNYVQYMGRDFLAQIPFIGTLINYLVGPLWDVYYTRNIGRINRTLLRSRSDGAEPQNDDGGEDAATQEQDEVQASSDESAEEVPAAKEVPASS